jgi:DNA-binding transcriptional MerR regulator
MNTGTPLRVFRGLAQQSFYYLLIIFRIPYLQTKNLFIPPYMKQFKIHDLEILSEVKAQTIRVWELRYEVFCPQRSVTNVRYYSVQDLKRLLDISLLLQHGYRISNVFKCSSEHLAALIKTLTSAEAAIQKATHELIVSMYNSEIENFEDVLDSCVLTAGIDATVTKVILPFLTRTRLLSYNDSTGDTHFVVTAIRKKIIHAIESAHPVVFDHKKALLFLPEKEHYDLLLLYAAYVLKCKGVRVLYLGTNVSMKTLHEVIDSKMPDFCVTHLPEPQRTRLASFLPQPSCKRLYVVTSHADRADECDKNIFFVSYLFLADVFKCHLELVS